MAEDLIINGLYMQDMMTVENMVVTKK